MPRLSFNRAIMDWHNRPQSLAQASEVRGSFPGLVGQTRFQIMLDLDQRLAQRLLEIMDGAIGATEISDSKRDAIMQSRLRLIEAFPDLV